MFSILLFNSFVTATGCCLLLLFLSQVVVHYQFIIIWRYSTCFRKSHQRCSKVFYQKNCSSQYSLEHFAIFSAKHRLRWNFFYNNLAGLRTATLLKRDSYAGLFLWILQNFCGFFGFVFIRMLSCGIDKSWNISSFFLQSW